MHKLILTLGVLIQSIVTLLGQSSSPLYSRALQFQLGEVNQYTDEVDWIGEPQPVNILVQINKGELIIYSEQHQVYQITQRINQLDNTTMYTATDKKGITCLLFFTSILSQDYYSRQMVVTIRYSDYAWLYLCTEETN